MTPEKSKFINRDISWLSFNARVLQEASDKTVPLIERFKFLGIFSSNLDEFFRVRVATVKRMMSLGKRQARELLSGDPALILNTIQATVLKQSRRFEQIYDKLISELVKEKIHLIDEKKLNDEQGEFVRSYFQQEVRPTLIPIMLDQIPEFPFLKDHAIYLVVDMIKLDSNGDKSYALIEVPSDILPRFLVLPQVGENKYIILLDDVIRFCLNDIFSVFHFKTLDAYTIKVTRDAELDLDNDVIEGYIEQITKSLKQRKQGPPVRFIFDTQIPDDLLQSLLRRLNLRKADSIMPGGRYHNHRDFIHFPNIGRRELIYRSAPPLPNPDINHQYGLLRTIAGRDIMLHYPYQSFHYITDLLREASIDPDVKSIKMTLYRVAKNSNIVNALINAVKNGKDVMAVMELQARFDEEANIYWMQKLEEEGARVDTGVPGLKVHSKLCLITRKEGDKLVRYAYIGTGNFNEFTARIYCDDGLLTSDKRLTLEVENVFQFFVDNKSKGRFKHLLVSPFNLQRQFIKLIDFEIKNAKRGKDAWMILKMNSLSDQVMMDKLYEASQAGVRIQLIIRGICSLIPGLPGLSENIEAISIVDKYLEHSRVFLFCHGGNQQCYISSADWMSRNLYYRAEVACPIYDPALQAELRHMLEIQLQDNKKARNLCTGQTNRYKRQGRSSPVRAQIEIYEYLKSKLSPPAGRAE